MRIRSYKYAIACVICLLLVSCMGDDKERVSIQEYGVSTLGARKNIRTESGYLVTAPEIESITDLQAGQCFLLEYRSVFEELRSDKETEVEILMLDSISRFPLVPEMTDTTIILNNEEILKSVNFAGSRYLYGYLFMQTQHGITLQDEEELFELSYDAANSSLAVGDTVLYDLFLRVVKENGTDTLKIRDKRYISAFDIQSLMDNAQPIINKNGKEEVALRLNYASGYNEAEKKLKWSATDTLYLLR